MDSSSWPGACQAGAPDGTPSAHSARRPRREAREAVDAGRVPLVLVGRDALGPLALGPVEQLRALALIAVARHAVAARVGDALERDGDDGARVRERREARGLRRV